MIAFVLVGMVSRAQLRDIVNTLIKMYFFRVFGPPTRAPYLLFCVGIVCFYKGRAQRAPALWRTGSGPPKAQSAQQQNVFLEQGRAQASFGSKARGCTGVFSHQMSKKLLLVPRRQKKIKKLADHTEQLVPPTKLLISAFNAPARYRRAGQYYAIFTSRAPGISNIAARWQGLRVPLCC